uniref:Uncharacterized protein n=1 Tax=Cucumis sativus TaxID=3659 RepID=A0A0A0KE29_CUCSA
MNHTKGDFKNITSTRDPIIEAFDLIHKPKMQKPKLLRPICIPLHIHILIAEVNPRHGLSQSKAHLCKNIRITVMCCGLYNSPSSSCWIAALEHAGADEHSVASQLHHHRRISRSCNSSSCEMHHR